MRIFFIGTVKFSEGLLEELVKYKDFEIIGIATKKKSTFNSDHCDLSTIAKKHLIPYKYIIDINSVDCYNWIKKLNPDIIYCFGWSSLIKEKLLNISKYGVIGYHPTSLPKNRGRHPIIWTLVLGLRKTSSTFFKMDLGADSGKIISQVSLEVDQNDDARTLYLKLLKVAKTQIIKLTYSFINNKIKYNVQSNKNINYWRKRNKEDGKINFSCSSKVICNLVRGLTKPYVGAHLIYNNNEIKIWKKIIGPKKDINLEPGKIIKINNKDILVKTSDSSVWLIDHEFKKLPLINSYMS